MSVLELGSEEAAQRAQEFTATVEETRVQYGGSAQLVSAWVRSLNAKLDASAAADTVDLAGRLRAVVDEFIRFGEGDEARAVDEMTRIATEYAESWRQTAAARTEDELAQISRRARALTEATVAGLRQVAQEPLDVRLHIATEPIALPKTAAFPTSRRTWPTQPPQSRASCAAGFLADCVAAGSRTPARHRRRSR